MTRIRITVIIVLTACVALWSCEKGDTRETPSGFKFSVIKKGDGRLPKVGEVVIMDMIITDSNDSLWHNSKLEQYPEMAQIAPEAMKETEHGLVETFRLISKGDSIVLRMRASEFFPLVWRATVPSYMDPATVFTTHVLCREILDSTGYREFITKLDSINFAKGEDRYDDLQEKMTSSPADDQLATDMNIIDAYLSSKNMTAQKLPSGLRYILKKEGKGATAKDGDFATMRYTGQNLDGREFDSGEYGYTIGIREVIEGWDEIAKVMKEGTSLTVFIPSTMAYGHGGRPPVIMPDAILIFDMECLSLKRR